MVILERRYPYNVIELFSMHYNHDLYISITQVI